ncbi:MAG TPA: EamA family transporter RarD [Candidatus Aminicenantes bacterium]|nr:EamA family transporter RarD [Candidatus Aminicenantes bacterium]
MWSSTREKKGIIYALLAYTSWGILPLYWKALQAIPASQILAHRIIWSFIYLALFLGFKRAGSEWLKTFRQPGSRQSTLLTAVIIGSNWFIYIWAINSGHVIEASFGYYINPLISVLLGVIFLGEKLTTGQKIAFGFALSGVVLLTGGYGRFPWIALALALTFGFYGLLRKISPVGSVIGLATETGLLTPLAVGFLLAVHLSSAKNPNYSPLTIILLLGSGLVTATPLLWFTKGVRRVPLSTIGFLQYISPSLQLFLGAVVFQESFTLIHLISFILIWIALIIFSFSTGRQISPQATFNQTNRPEKNRNS